MNEELATVLIRAGMSGIVVSIETAAVARRQIKTMNTPDFIGLKD